MSLYIRKNDGHYSFHSEPRLVFPELKTPRQLRKHFVIAACGSSICFADSKVLLRNTEVMLELLGSGLPLQQILHVRGNEETF